MHNNISMTVVEAKIIMDALSKHGRSGCSLSRLAQDTKIDPHDLRAYMGKYLHFFTKVGDEPKYVLNRFGKYKGSPERMLIAYEKEKEQSQRNMHIYWGVILFSLLVVVLLLIQNLD